MRHEFVEQFVAPAATCSPPIVLTSFSVFTAPAATCSHSQLIPNFDTLFRVCRTCSHLQPIHCSDSLLLVLSTRHMALRVSHVTLLFDPMTSQCRMNCVWQSARAWPRDFEPTKPHKNWQLLLNTKTAIVMRTASVLQAFHARGWTGHRLSFVIDDVIRHHSVPAATGDGALT